MSGLDPDRVREVTDLRTQAIEALWYYCGGSAPDALDALLDFLTEHADDVAESNPNPLFVGGDVLELVAALRETE